MKKLILISISLFLISCGTGPWFLRPNIYKTYKYPIYDDSNYYVKTNGFYIQEGELQTNSHHRRFLIFTENGYVISGAIKDNNYKEEIEKNLLNNNNFDWYKIDNDSIIIEYFANPSIEMFSSVYYKRGKIKSEEIIEMYYDQFPNELYTYKFNQMDLPKLKNKSAYLNKKWYQKNINQNRK